MKADSRLTSGSASPCCFEAGRTELPAARDITTRFASWTEKRPSANRLNGSIQERRQMPSKTEKLLSLLNGHPVIPVLKIANLADAVPLARALARGGLPAIEITLRTADALKAIRRGAGGVGDAGRRAGH